MDCFESDTSTMGKKCTGNKGIIAYAVYIWRYMLNTTVFAFLPSKC